MSNDADATVDQLKKAEAIVDDLERRLGLLCTWKIVGMRLYAWYGVCPVILKVSWAWSETKGIWRGGEAGICNPDAIMQTVRDATSIQKGA